MTAGISGRANAGMPAGVRVSGTGIVAVIVTTVIVVGRCLTALDYAAGGGAAGVPHSAQNLAAGLRLALQFVQCLLVGVPHSGQNFAPTVIALWQLVHAIVAAGTASAGAGCGGACGGAAC